MSEKLRSEKILPQEFPILEMQMDRLGVLPQSFTIHTGRNPRQLETVLITSITSLTTERKKDQIVAENYTVRTQNGFISLMHDLLKYSWQIVSVKQISSEK